METLTDAIVAATGVRPTSYRAGRWGLSTAQIPILLALGYQADCSVTPGISWRGEAGLREGGPDFTTAPAAPYVLADDDLSRPGSSGLLEVPVTIVHTNAFMRSVGAARLWYQRHQRSLPARAANRFWRIAPQWFRPFPDMSADHLLAVYATADRVDLPVIQMMLHSSELLPGGSPSYATEAAVDQLFARLTTVFRRLASAGVTGVTLSEFARLLHPVRA